jgi:hypothetical protein
MTQGSRQINRVGESPSALWFVTGGEPRIEILRNEPGGFNLLTTPAFEQDANSDGVVDGWIGYQSGPEAVTYSIQTAGGVDDGVFQRVSWVGNNTGAKGIGRNSGAVAGAWQQNQWYTVSFYARATGTSVGQVARLVWNTGPDNIVTIAQPPLTTSWQRYVFKLRWVATVPNNQIYITLQVNSGTNGSLDIDQVQAETGEVPSAFSPQLGEIVTGVAGQLEFSLNGRSDWQTSMRVPLSGLLFARYTPTAITSDFVRYPSFTVGAVAYQAEALELTGVPLESQHQQDFLYALPRVYREGLLASEATVGILAALAWTAYPLRCLLVRNDALLDGSLAPSHTLEDIRQLFGLPSLEGLAVSMRRSIIANAANYFRRGGSTELIRELVEIYSSATPDIVYISPYRVLISTTPLPIPVESVKKQLAFWMPAWVEWDLYDGFFDDGTYYADGAVAADGKPYP